MMLHWNDCLPRLFCIMRVVCHAASGGRGAGVMPRVAAEVPAADPEAEAPVAAVPAAGPEAEAAAPAAETIPSAAVGLTSRRAATGGPAAPTAQQFADGQLHQLSVRSWRTSCSDSTAISPRVRSGSILLPLMLKMATLFWPRSSDGR